MLKAGWVWVGLGKEQLFILIIILLQNITALLKPIFYHWTINMHITLWRAYFYVCTRQRLKLFPDPVGCLSVSVVNAAPKKTRWSGIKNKTLSSLFLSTSKQFFIASVISLIKNSAKGSLNIWCSLVWHSFGRNYRHDGAGFWKQIHVFFPVEKKKKRVKNVLLLHHFVRLSL